MRNENVQRGARKQGDNFTVCVSEDRKTRKAVQGPYLFRTKFHYMDQTHEPLWSRISLPTCPLNLDMYEVCPWAGADPGLCVRGAVPFPLPSLPFLLTSSPFFPLPHFHSRHFPFPLPPLLFLPSSRLISIRSRVPLKPARGSGERCKFLQRGPGLHENEFGAL